MAKDRVPRIEDPNQVDLGDLLPQPKRYFTDPVPGNESQFLHERSVASLYLDEHGREVLSPVPMAPPVGYQKPISIAEQMRQMIKMASYEAAMAGAETEDEANDFEVDEDMDPHSPWENDFEPDPALEAMMALQSRPPAAPSAVPAAPNPPAPPAEPSGQQPAASHAAQRT